MKYVFLFLVIIAMCLAIAVFVKNVVLFIKQRKEKKRGVKDEKNNNNVG